MSQNKPFAILAHRITAKRPQCACQCCKKLGRFHFQLIECSELLAWRAWHKPEVEQNFGTLRHTIGIQRGPAKMRDLLSKGLSGKKRDITRWDGNSVTMETSHLNRLMCVTQQIHVLFRESSCQICQIGAWFIIRFPAWPSCSWKLAVFDAPFISRCLLAMLVYRTSKLILAIYCICAQLD